MPQKVLQSRPARNAKAATLPPPPLARPKKSSYFLRSVAKAMEALEILAKSGEPLSLQQMRIRLRITKVAALRILSTLETLGDIARGEDGNYFAVGRRPNQITPRLLDRLLKVGVPAIEKLNLEYRETASLAALFENHSEVIAVSESSQLIRMGNIVGRILPPHASSLGKAITAFQPLEIQDRLLRSYGLPRFTPSTVIDQMLLRDEFEQIQKDCIAEDFEESAFGGCCFGAPILHPGDYAIGAVSLSLPKDRLRDEDHRRNIQHAVQRTAKLIRLELEKMAGITS